MSSAKLVAGTSTKREVVDRIGLPKSVERRADGIEVWYYTGLADNTSYFVPMPIATVPAGGNMSTLYYANVGPDVASKLNQYSVVCLFDANGVLKEFHKGKP